jgi:predicted ATP-dependent serine protease
MPSSKDAKKSRVTNRLSGIEELDHILGGGFPAKRAIAGRIRLPGVRRKVEDEGVRVAVIDSLNGYLTAMTSERFLPAQLHELLAYLNAHELLTMHLVGYSQIPGRNGGFVEFRAPVRLKRL